MNNVTGSVIVQWRSPETVFKRVDRYYIYYRAVNEPHIYEKVINDVNSSSDIYEVSSFSTHLPSVL